MKTYYAFRILTENSFLFYIAEFQFPVHMKFQTQLKHTPKDKIIKTDIGSVKANSVDDALNKIQNNEWENVFSTQRE